MSLFACEQCGCVENTACCNYWSRQMEKQPLLCSEGDPEIGEWHGEFPKRIPEDAGYVLNERGFLGPPKKEGRHAYR
jgi:hypothetical protein